MGAVLRGRGGWVVVAEKLARLRGRLASHAGEEADEAVEIVLGPAVEGMVVAFRALDPDAGEQLRHVEGDRRPLRAAPLVVGKDGSKLKDADISGNNPGMRMTTSFR